MASKERKPQYRSEDEEPRRTNEEPRRIEDDRRIERVERMERVYPGQGEAVEQPSRRQGADADVTPSRERWSSQRERVEYRRPAEGMPPSERSRVGDRAMRSDSPPDLGDRLETRPASAESDRRERPAERPSYVPLSPTRTAPTPLARVRHAVDYLFYILYGVLAIRLVLALLGASEGAAFTRLIHDVSGPFYAPFEGIVARPAVDGSYFDAPVVIAILAYGLLHLSIRGLIRVVEGRPPNR